MVQGERAPANGFQVISTSRGDPSPVLVTRRDYRRHRLRTTEAVVLAELPCSRRTKNVSIVADIVTGEQEVVLVGRADYRVRT